MYIITNTLYFLGNITLATILIIDDEDIIRRSVRKILELEGHTVQDAALGQQGLTLARANPPDLIITDIFMPDKDGLEIIRALNLENPNLKILAMTGGGATGGFNPLPLARALGAHVSLDKPFQREDLLEAVEKVLNT